MGFVTLSSLPAPPYRLPDPRPAHATVPTLHRPIAGPIDAPRSARGPAPAAEAPHRGASRRTHPALDKRDPAGVSPGENDRVCGLLERRHGNSQFGSPTVAMATGRADPSREAAMTGNRRLPKLVGLSVEMDSLTFRPHDHDELHGTVDGTEPVGRPGGELGGLARLDDVLYVVEQ
jgi:hypothetical protein